MIDGIKHKRAHLLALLLAGALAFTSTAQQPLLKTIRADRPNMMFGSVMPEGDSFIVTGVTQNPAEPYIDRSIIGMINAQGGIEQINYVFDNQAKTYATFSNSLLKSDDGNYIYTGYSLKDFLGIIVIKADNNLDAVIYEKDSNELFAYQGKYIVENSGNYYVAGVITKSAKSNILLVKMNLNGEVKWQKVFGTSILAESSTSLINLNNGNLMIGSFRRDYETPIETANTWLLEVDTAGEIVRQWFDSNDSTLGAYGLKQTSDGGFIYGAQNIHYQSINGPSFIGSIVKLDSNFNVEWRWTGGYPHELTGIYDIEELPDGTFVGCGNSTYLNGTVMVGAWVVKLSASGQQIWNRYYSAFNSMDSENYLNDIDLLPNGNMVAVGETRDFTEVDRGQMGLLMVMDSNGCVIENCTVGIEDIEPKAGISIYPNPTSEQLTIEIPNAVFSAVEVFNINGMHIQDVQIPKGAATVRFDVSAYPAGVYLARLNGSLQSKFVIVK